MMPNEIQLPRKLTHQLLQLAQAEPEQEVCGLVGADANGLPVSCYPIQNSSETPHNRFSLDASQHIAAMKAMRDKNEHLFAIFHSHPHAPAEPSRLDIEQAQDLNTLHLIISLNTKGVLELRCFSIEAEQVTEVALCLIENA